MPRDNQRKQRRVNPDKAPWDQLPIIVFHPDPSHVETPMADDNWDDVVDFLDTYDPADHDPDRLAVIRNGTITVTRGTFDIATLPERCLSVMENHPGEEFVVETDGLGRIDVARRSALTDAKLLDIGLENVGYLAPLAVPSAAKHDTLAGYAHALRDHAPPTLGLADTYDRLAADGWDLAATPPPGMWWPPLAAQPTRTSPDPPHLRRPVRALLGRDVPVALVADPLGRVGC
jgi:hypothetical protein